MFTTFDFERITYALEGLSDEAYNELIKLDDAVIYGVITGEITSRERAAIKAKLVRRLKKVGVTYADWRIWADEF